MARNPFFISTPPFGMIMYLDEEGFTIVAALLGNKFDAKWLRGGLSIEFLVSARSANTPQAKMAAEQN
ncbi:hypothetical protein BK123_10530 [Paenibacillus lautus]|uniref:Uncharacterized protein n=2 Tax=Paenibacillus TaxID=44249 RepID=A0A1R1B3I9_PAELA|nr:hypothetical protein BK123_10530 [Paenibacillus lautus]